MNILDVNKSVKAHKQKRRVGRGNASGWGTTAGRGHKGHGQKSGKSLMKTEGGQMQVFRAIPKRGFNNSRYRTEYVALNLSTLESRFDAGATVDPEAIKAKGIIKNITCIKVLAKGEISKALTVKAHAFSKTAIEKIEKAGGKAEVIK